MKESDFFILLHIAKATGLYGELETSTSRLALELGISQQSVSRKLRELESTGFIERTISPRGVAVALTGRGKKEVEILFNELKSLFTGKKKQKKLLGIVSSGLGEGAYYISQKNYISQFKKKLGFRPFIGTLNLLAEPTEILNFLSGEKPLEIAGFKTIEREFGSLQCFKVKINGKVAGAIVVPERTAHEKDLVEVIAPINLRKKFNLRDGKKIELALQ